MRYTTPEEMAKRMAENMRTPGWRLPAMRTCPVCRAQCNHPRGDGCEKCRPEVR